MLLRDTAEATPSIGRTSSSRTVGHQFAHSIRPATDLAECLQGRVIPGFSSDLIRLDQARSRKPVPNQSRLNKLRAVNDAKTAFRREREEARAKSLAEAQEPSAMDVDTVAPAAAPPAVLV